jgi:RimJ/RimL family protein N-acetyltransferase
MAFSMREAFEDDVEFIVQLFELPHAQEFLNAPSRDIVEASLDDPQTENYIIEDDGEPIGNFALGNHEWLFDFRTLVIAKPRRGAGRFALEWGLHYAFEECGAHRVFLEIREDNAGTRRLCESLGFVAEGCYRDGFRDARTGEYRNLIPYGVVAARGPEHR